MLKTNEGMLDRAIRVVLGLVLLAVAYTQQITWLYVVAAVALVTGAVGFCGLYSLFGMSTCPVKKKK